MKKLRLGNVLLCDYLTPGQGNKHVLVNTYTSDIVVSELPARMQFGLYAEIFLYPDQPRELQVDIVVGQKRIIEIQAEFADNSGGPALLAIPTFPVPASKETTLQIVLICDGYQKTTALKKAIRLATA